jgi:methyl-accepting chemotaxis protein
MGLNALILARRAGDKARGFGVLSNELRQLTRPLSEVMSRLQDTTRESVSSVTQRAKQERILRVLARCRTLPGRCGTLAEGPMTRL